jgi:exodeoxyribonuclease VII large subunit
MDTEIITVSELNRSCKNLLETEFTSIWVEGELSNFVCPASGHWYFTLKDARSQVRCAMFRGQNRKVSALPKPGDAIKVLATVTLYEARGDYQLLVSALEPAGLGKLQQEYERLLKKLKGEGLFDPTHKQSLPKDIQTIGVITSPTGAAIRDILHVLNRRFPAIRVILYPSLVQGAEAPLQLLAALRSATERNECDVLLLSRGGGSIEDLWAFNDETLARAIFHCPIPTISGVGHEIDFTLLDFVADQRAPTPSAAAELLSPDQAEYYHRFTQIDHQLIHVMQAILSLHQQSLADLLHRLITQDPERILQQQQQTLDTLSHQLALAIQHHFKAIRHRHTQLRQILQSCHPTHRIHESRGQLRFQIKQLNNTLQALFLKKKTEFSSLAHALHTISPLATLGRGYSILSEKGSHTPITVATSLKPNDVICNRLQKGKVFSIVQSTEKT